MNPGEVVILLILVVLPLVPAMVVYMVFHRHYRNTGESHAYEHETDVNMAAPTGSEERVSRIVGTRAKRIRDDNVSAYRKRVARILD